LRPQWCDIGEASAAGWSDLHDRAIFFRYDEDGRLAEEWAQFDNLGFLRQLGVAGAEIRTARIENR